VLITSCLIDLLLYVFSPDWPDRNINLKRKAFGSVLPGGPSLHQMWSFSKANFSVKFGGPELPDLLLYVFSLDWPDRNINLKRKASGSVLPGGPSLHQMWSFSKANFAMKFGGPRVARTAPKCIF
jgi:hypothetical protein